MTNELIKVSNNDKGEQIVSGRELYEFLGIKTQYTKWFERMIEYGFVENIDFAPISQKRLTAQGNESTYTDHVIKIDMAKEISMIQRSDKGKQARLYFIEMEKKAKTLQLHSYMINDPIKRAEKWIEEQKEKQLLEQQVEEQKPLVTFAEKCIKTNDSILVRELAKVITEQGIINIGEKKLYTKLREWGLVLSNGTEPSQKAMNMELFEVVQRPIKTPYGERLERTTKVSPKGQVYIVEKLYKELKALSK